MPGYVRKLWSGTGGSQLDQRIRAVRKSYIRQRRDIERKYPSFKGMCCLGCAYGSAYSEDVARKNRTKSDLVRLLKERTRNDAAEIARLSPADE